MELFNSGSWNTKKVSFSEKKSSIQFEKDIRIYDCEFVKRQKEKKNCIEVAFVRGIY